MNKIFIALLLLFIGTRSATVQINATVIGNGNYELRPENVEAGNPDTIILIPDAFNTLYNVTCDTSYMGAGKNRDTLIWSSLDIDKNITVRFRSVYTVSIKIESDLVDSTFSHFPVQIDLSNSYDTLPTFRSNAKNATQIGIFDTSINAYLPKMVNIDTATKKLLITFDCAIDSIIDKTVFLYAFGEDFKSNSTAAFTLSGVKEQFSFEEPVATGTLQGSINNPTGTTNGSLVQGTTGKYGKCIAVDKWANGNVTFSSAVMDTSSHSMEFIIKLDSVYSSSQYFIHEGAPTIIISSSNDKMAFTNDYSHYPSSGAGSISLSTWYHTIITCDNSNLTNFYINGLLKGLANQDAGEGTSSSTVFMSQSGYSGQFYGRLDEVVFYTDVKTKDYGSTRYNRFFSPNSFFNVVIIPIIDSIRPNPNYRNDSCSLYASGIETSGGGMRIIELNDTITVYDKTVSGKWDFQTKGWSRGRYNIEVWNSTGDKDTSYLRIVTPRVRP